MKVGTVTGVKVVDKRYAEVSFKVKKGVKLYTTTKARIRYLNLIGGRFLALDERGRANAPLAGAEAARGNPAHADHAGARSHGRCSTDSSRCSRH